MIALIIGIYFFVGITSAILNLMRWISPIILLPFLPVIAIINIFFGNENQKKEALVIFKLFGTIAAFPIIPFVKAYQIRVTQPILAFTYVALYSLLYFLLSVCVLFHILA